MPSSKTLEELIKALEDRLPGFTYTVNSFGPGKPIFFTWQHQEPKFFKKESLMPRSMVADSFRDALETVWDRYERLDEPKAKKKKAPPKEEPIVPAIKRPRFQPKGPA